MATFEVFPVVHPLDVLAEKPRTVHVPVPSAINRGPSTLLTEFRVDERAFASTGAGLDFSGALVELKPPSKVQPNHRMREFAAPRLQAAEAVSSTEVDAVFDHDMRLETLGPAAFAFDDIRVSALSTRMATANRARVTIVEPLDGLALQMTVTGARDIDPLFDDNEDGLGNFVDANYRTAGFVGIGVPPFISQVKRITATRIRVTFSEPMRDNGKLRSPSSYRVRAVSADAFPVFVGTVTPNPREENPTFVDLDITEQTDNKSYEVVASAVTDFAGNVVTGASVGFTGVGSSPSVEKVVAVSAARVDVYFDKAIRKTPDSLNPTSYTWDNGLTTVSVLKVEKNVVSLATSPQTPGVVYGLTIPL